MNNRLKRLKQVTAKPVTSNHVEKRFLDEEVKFPMVFDCKESGVILANWIQAHQDMFNQTLLKYGAILCRGFKINTVEKFQFLMKTFPEQLIAYKMRSSPRYALADNIYVSTTYPEELSINMHSESSYAPAHPARIVFCCIKKAAIGGQTPIADNRKILDHLSDTMKAAFIEKGILYKRNISSMLGLDWKEVFQTSDKTIVAKECEANGMDYNWIGEDRITLSWQKKAVWQHPQTNDSVWFNHGLFFNKHMLEESILDSVESHDDLPNNTFYGDGTEISKEEIEKIKKAYQKATVEFDWQVGDVLFLDNMIASHGRNPYQGERQIAVSIS